MRAFQPWSKSSPHNRNILVRFTTGAACRRLAAIFASVAVVTPHLIMPGRRGRNGDSCEGAGKWSRSTDDLVRRRRPLWVGRTLLPLLEAQRHARPIARRRTEGRERLLAVRLIELHELVGELVTEVYLVVRNAPVRTGFTARLRLDAERLVPEIAVAEGIGDTVQHAGRAKGTFEDLERSFRLAVEDLVFRRLLAGSAQVGLQRLVPRPRGVAVVAHAGAAPILRQVHFARQVVELIRVRSDHQANDVVGALQVEAVRVVKDHGLAGLAAAPIEDHPALRRVDQDPVRELSL